MIIAEVGINHNGDMALAADLINLAKLNGADLCKFQLYDSNQLNVEGLHRKAELTKQQAIDLFNYGEKVGIEVFFSVSDIYRVWWCEDIGVKRYKIPYTQRGNVNLIQTCQNTGKQIFISGQFPPQGRIAGIDYQMSYLYCIPHYPAQIDEYILDKLSGYDGISDHTIGLECAKEALKRGATIIEKHFALDHHTGLDAPWSMAPDELRELKEWEKQSL